MNRNVDIPGEDDKPGQPRSYEEQSASVTVEDLADQLHETSLGDPIATGDHEGEAQENGPNFDIYRGTQEAERQPLDAKLTPVRDDEPRPLSEPSQATVINQDSSHTPIYDDPSDEDDGEGEWITPSNVSIYRSRALELLPDDGVKGKSGKKVEQVESGCMTADFAMQNVLLQMGLNLVGLEGKRIEKIKSWVLRCHACFK